MASAQLAQYQAARWYAHALGIHDFKGYGHLDNTILMYTRLVSEGIGANDSFVRLHGEPGQLAYHPTRFIDLLCIYPRIEVKQVAAGFNSHHDFLKRGIARPLTDAIDCALNLPASISHRFQAIGHCQAKVIMTVHTDHRLLNTGYILENTSDEPAKFLWYGVPHGIRYIEGDGAGFNRHLEYLVQIGWFGSAGVHWREFDVACVALCT